MAKHNEVFVVEHPQGWAVKKPNADRASAVFPTQAKAVKRAHRIAGNGPVHIMSRHGGFRKETRYG